MPKSKTKRRRVMTPEEESKTDIISQIEEKLPEADRETLLGILTTLKNRRDARECHFDKLPDEIVLKILNHFPSSSPKSLYSFDLCRWKHEYLIDTIANISTRFRRLAADKSFWKGRVVTSLAQGMKNILLGSLTEDTTSLHTSINSNDYSIDIMTAADIAVVSAKCPNMNSLQLSHITAWPTLNIPWRSLKILVVERSNINAFLNVELGSSLPNLVSFNMTKGGTLPDMSNCKNLQKVALEHGRFSFPEKIPLPKCLKMLHGYEAELDWDWASLVKHFDDCSIYDVYKDELVCLRS